MYHHPLQNFLCSFCDDTVYLFQSLVLPLSPVTPVLYIHQSSTFSTNPSPQEEQYVLYHVYHTYSHAWSLLGLFFQRQWTLSSAFGYHHSLQLLRLLLRLIPRRRGLQLQLGACYSHALHLLVGEALNIELGEIFHHEQVGNFYLYLYVVTAKPNPPLHHGGQGSISKTVKRN